MRARTRTQLDKCRSQAQRAVSELLVTQFKPVALDHRHRTRQTSRNAKQSVRKIQGASAASATKHRKASKSRASPCNNSRPRFSVSGWLAQR